MGDIVQLLNQAVDPVVAVAADQMIGTLPVMQFVVPLPALDHVVAVGAEHPVVAQAGEHHVVTDPAVDRVLGTSAGQAVISSVPKKTGILSPFDYVLWC